MAIIYQCRHCQHIIGELKEQIISTSMLGFHRLSVKDFEKMIHYKDNGDVHIFSICENCEQSLTEHPDYYELEHFLQ